MISDEERACLSKEIGSIQSKLEQPPNPAETMELVGRLLMTYPMASMTEAKASALSEAYLDALDDLPSWTIREASRRWHRGDVEELGDVNTSFAPSPSQIRKLAVSEFYEAKGLVLSMERMLYQPDRAMIDKYRAERDANEASKPKLSSGPREIPEAVKLLLTQLTGNMKYMDKD